MEFDEAKHGELLKKAVEMKAPPAILKYLTDPGLMRIVAKTELAMAGLQTWPARKVLEISAGAGWLAWEMQKAGHEVYVTDVDKWPYSAFRWWREEVFGLTRFEELIYRMRDSHDPAKFHYDYQPMPFPGVVFDVVVGIAVPPMNRWRVDEWLMFLADLRLRTNGKGRAYLRLNRDTTNMVDRGRKALIEAAAMAGVSMIENDSRFHIELMEG